MDLTWTIDFDNQVIRGRAIIIMKAEECTTPTTAIVLDSKGLIISATKAAVWISTNSYSPPDTLQLTPVSLTSLGNESSNLGEGCQLSGDVIKHLAPTNTGGGSIYVLLSLDYKTPADAQALCWLDAAQTSDQTHPFVYSQCQAIHARTLVPCQDTPSVRFSFTATVQCLWSGKESSAMRPLMSALELCDAVAFRDARRALLAGSATLDRFDAEHQADFSSSHSKTFYFHQPVPIPAYLIAIAAGRIESADVSNRCRIYAEPSMLSASVREFDDVERFVSTAEDLAGRYVWQRYDLLVLPASFPFGGMENPNLTFVTPTVICGDKSLVELVAHEVCHSWSGNLVSIENWSEFWLNEGFTVFLQRKITEKIHGYSVAEFEGCCCENHLRDDVRRFGSSHEYTKLRPNLSDGADPDDAFSSVPYEKGYAFVRHLEKQCGGDVPFMAFLKERYFVEFALKSISTIDLRRLYEDQFPFTKGAIDWLNWCHAPGMPLVPPDFDRSLLASCETKVNEILHEIDNGSPAGVTQTQVCDVLSPTLALWTDSQRVAFFELLLQRTVDEPQTPWPHDIVEAIGSNLRCDIGDGRPFSLNTELQHRWFLFALQQQRISLQGQTCPFTGHIPGMRLFLGRIGRLKFARPLYRAWSAISPGSSDAITFFKQHQSCLHPVTQKMVSRDFLTAGISI